ncbi:hypothetical protein [Marinobacterium weihaiense]|uniref:Uncharacterized protein n=1 Tax=Marinobacterium weihaiense TaxID=2851016 RepID=A0ABS6M7I1_9GAMM|nr:hypothetical protein [Marinobacterium weihaiense]MBV0931742.1 hypothetical protein [Marinobacterium weihaiense]
MSDTLQDRLVRTAVTGLSQAADLDSLIPADLTDTFVREHFRSDAECFLQLLSLQQLEHSIARLPAATDAIEPLPPEPGVVLQTPAPQCLTAFAQLQERFTQSGVQALLCCMLNAGYALPDELALKAFGGGYRGLDDLCGLGASPRVRWMLSLLPAWSQRLSTGSSDWIAPAQRLLRHPDQAVSDADQEHWIQIFNDGRANLRGWLMRALARTPATVQAGFIRAAWGRTRAEGRTALVHLLAGISDWLLSPDGQDMHDWLHNLPDERATSVRQLLALLKTRLQLVAAPADEHINRLKQATAACFTTAKKARFDLQAPEALTPELITLGVADIRCHEDLDISKPAARLGQLIRLSGPSLWAELLDTCEEDACRLLLESRYCKELLPFMQDSLFWHRQLHLLPILYDAADQPKRFHLQHSLARLAAGHVVNQPQAATALVDSIRQQDAWHLLQLGRFDEALLLAGVELTPTDSLRWWQQLQPELIDDYGPGPCTLLLLNLTTEQLNRPPEHKDKLTEDQLTLYRDHCQRIGEAMAFRQSLTHSQASTSQGDHP